VDVITRGQVVFAREYRCERGSDGWCSAVDATPRQERRQVIERLGPDGGIKMGDGKYSGFGGFVRVWRSRGFPRLAGGMWRSGCGAGAGAAPGALLPMTTRNRVGGLTAVDSVGCWVLLGITNRGHSTLTKAG
jgi:hypothetical protein